MKEIAAALACCFTAAASFAATPSPINPLCQKLNLEWETNDRLIALATAKGSVDNSAPRETNRKIEISVYTANKSMLLQIMAQRKCDAPTSVMGSNEYQISALRCVTATVGRNQPDVDKSCNVQSWIKDGDIVKNEQQAKERSASNADSGALMFPDSKCQIPPCYHPNGGATQ